MTFGVEGHILTEHKVVIGPNDLVPNNSQVLNYTGKKGLGFREEGLGFRVQGLEFRVQGSGFRVLRVGFRV